MNLTINAKSTTNRSPALSPTNWFPVQLKIVSQSYYMDANKLDDSQVPKHICRSSHHVVQQTVGTMQTSSLGNILGQQRRITSFVLESRLAQCMLYQAECFLSSRICAHSLTLKLGNTIWMLETACKAKRCKMWRLRHRQSGPLLEQ